ncbi:uncharacterized protein LOC144451183 [Glandiceps talaboti]
MTGPRTFSLLFLLLGVLHTILVVGANSNDRRTFKYEDPATGQRRKCAKCPPGTFVEEPCINSEEDTTCKPCPEGHFSLAWNHYRQCAPCRQCAASLVTTPCSAMEDTVCSCGEGLFWHDHTCKPHKSCPTGRGVVMRGTATYNTLCERCPDGTYSDVDSPTQPCLNFTNCLLLGRDIIKEGDRYKDNICSDVVARTTTQIVTTKKTTVSPTTKKQATTRAHITQRPTTNTVTLTPKLPKEHPLIPHKSPPHHPDFNDEGFGVEKEDYFEEIENMELELEMELGRPDNGGKELNKNHRLRNQPSSKDHNIHEAGYDVQELNTSEHHDTSNGSGLAAGILGAGCLFLLVLIAVLYQRKKRLEEKQKLKELKQQPPEWQKLKQQGVSEENLTLLNKGKHQPSHDTVEEEGAAR